VGVLSVSTKKYSATFGDSFITNNPRLKIVHFWKCQRTVYPK